MSRIRQRVISCRGLRAALHFLHSPAMQVPTVEALACSAITRRGAALKFDEALAQQMSLRRAFLARRQQGAPVLQGDGALRGRCWRYCLLP
jgi:ATP-dependent DNA helicase RecG